MRARFIFLLTTLLVVGCRDGAISGHRTAEAGSSATQPEGVARRLWSGRDVDALGSPSADGKLLSFVDWNDGSGLALRDIATGQTRTIVSTRGDGREFAYYSVISPDAKQVAYSFWDGELYDLRIVGIEGGTSRTLFRKAEVRDLIPMAWSPDAGNILAFIQWKDLTSQIAFISAATGEARMLKTLGWRYPSELALSPDGRHIAYDSPRDETSDARDISILAIEAGTDTPVVVHEKDDRLRGWSRDGRLFFTSDRDGTPSLWALAVKNGRGVGAPVRLKSDLWRFDQALGLDANGVFYYSVHPTVADLYTATLDPTTLKITSPPQPIGGADGVTRGPGAWSPDGRLLAYLASEQAASVSFSSAVIRSAETGEERTLTPPLTAIAAVQWFPDGRSLMVQAIDLKGRRGLYRLDAQSGAVSVIRYRSPDEQNIIAPSLSPDRRTLFYRTFADAKGEVSLLMARDLQSEQEREIYRHPRPMSGASPSPDGRQLALAMVDEATRKTSIVILPATGGTPRTILSLPEGDVITQNLGLILWRGDNDLISIRTNAQRQSEIWNVKIDGSGAQKLDLNLPRMMQPRLHPDGRRLLFRAGEVTKEVWALQPAATH